jgi:catalase
LGLVLVAATICGEIAGAAEAPAEGSIAAQLVAAFDRVFKGPYAHERAIHAKGIVARGSFAAAPEAASLSMAEQLRTGGEPVPVIVRFSAFSGVPSQADGKPGANPAGVSIKFLLPNDVDTDIVAHAYNGFPAATGEDFLAYLQTVASSDPAARNAFLASHPAARRFVDDPKPTPLSYGTETYYGVDAFRFVNASGVGGFGRYRIEPVAGAQHLDAAQAAGLKPDYLADELRQRLKSGPAAFRLLVQLAATEDNVADPSTAWPADRPTVLLGTLSLTEIADASEPGMKTLFFSPMNLVPGIEPSPDPLLAARTRAYSISYRRRTAEQ